MLSCVYLVGEFQFWHFRRGRSPRECKLVTAMQISPILGLAGGRPSLGYWDAEEHLVETPNKRATSPLDSAALQRGPSTQEEV